MKKLAVLLGLLLSTLLLTSCATTAPGPVSQVEPPQRPQLCRPGFYFCPGEVVGCCPNGWGCASTHCVRPRHKVVTKACRPGFYFCPGDVMGCCPVGWGCAPTHCIRPARTQDL